MPVYIVDPDAFEKMAQVEGAAWAAYSTTHRARESFFAVRQAYCDVLCELERYGEKDPVAGHAAELMDNNVIYGESGYARYVVRNDGEIVLDRSSTRPERAQKAREVGFRVV